MRELKMVLDGSVCFDDFSATGPKTMAEARRATKVQCPNYQACEKDRSKDHQCIMRAALEVARWAIKMETTVEEEMAEFKSDHYVPKDGWLYSTDRRTFTVIPDGPESLRRIAAFAHTILDDGNGDARAAAMSVGDGFEDVMAFAQQPDGSIDLARMESLEGRFGSNGGRGCDVRSGPCSCGAWH